LTIGDITRQPFEDPAHSAIVNAANQGLHGGGGITGAIWRAAGDLTDVCQEALQDPKNKQKVDADGLKVGQAVITSSKKLKNIQVVDYVIHTPGPHGVDADRAALLANCYRNCLQVAQENDIHTIAFPSISTGIYGYPLKEATRIAISTVLAYLKEHQETTCIKEIRFIVWDKITHDLYQAMLADPKNQLHA
jgi:O-acetyl-ADP-ribose deacetylase (regulator of RNase III)